MESEIRERQNRVESVSDTVGRAHAYRHHILGKTPLFLIYCLLARTARQESRPTLHSLPLVSLRNALFQSCDFTNCLKRKRRDDNRRTSPSEKNCPNGETDGARKPDSVIQCYRTTRAPPPPTIFSTSFTVTIDVSPGVVIASAP
jgi:hypothetical protein